VLFGHRANDRKLHRLAGFGQFYRSWGARLVRLFSSRPPASSSFSVVLSILRNPLGIGQAPSEAVLAVLAACLPFTSWSVGRQMMDVSSAAAAGIDVDNLTSRVALEGRSKP